jgi:type II secretory pathway component PulJ
MRTNFGAISEFWQRSGESPSPRPSPRGRGGIGASRSGHRAASKKTGRGLRVSLSPSPRCRAVAAGWERAGVRGIAAGFTLIELVISGSLMALILVSGYLCLSAALSSQKLIEPRVEILQNARVAMNLMAADLRAACPLDKQFDLLGMSRKLGEMEADNLDFATHNYTPRHPNEGDFCEESFFVDKNLETGQLSLYRRRNPRLAVEPLTGGSKEEIATGVLGLHFEYFDGLDWYDTWGDAEGQGKPQTSNRQQPNLEGMPEAVRITLWLDSNPRARKPSDTATPPEKSETEPPLVFQTVARLNLAARSRPTDSTDSGTSSDASGQGNTGQTQ